MPCARLAVPLALLVPTFFLNSGCAGHVSELFVLPPVSSCDELAGVEPTNAGVLRVVTWNIKTAALSSLDVIADLLDSFDADVIALQEVDRFTERSGNLDQAAELGERLGMQHTFAAALEQSGGEYGIALLSRFPFSRAERIEMPRAGGFQPRVVIDADVCAGGAQPMRVLALHADVFPWAAAAQTRFVANLASESVGSGVVVTGDLNQTPEADGVRALGDVPLVDLSPQDVGTSDLSRHIDYLFVDDALTPEVGRVHDTDASDHRPVIADLQR